jgi:hypothetical protein
MTTRSMLILAVLLAALPAVAQEKPAPAPAESRPETRAPSTPLEHVAAIKAEFNAARDAFFKAYREAKNEEDQKKMVADIPKAADRAPKLMEIAKANPKTPAAFEALAWVVAQVRESDLAREALAILGRDHKDDPGLGAVAAGMRYSISAESEAFLRMAMKESPHPEVRGRATYTLGYVVRGKAEMVRRLKDAGDADEHKYARERAGKDLAKFEAMDPDALEREGEQLFVDVTEKFADVSIPYGRKTVKLADLAEGDLFEIRNLAIGKVAPEILGEDVDGKPMKLSDFAGKVVVLDYWGYW